MKMNTGIQVLCFLLFFIILSNENREQLERNTYKERRALLRKNLPSKAVVIFVNPPSLEYITEKPYRYFPESNFYYFTGLSIPEAIFVITSSDFKIGNNNAFNEFLILPEISPKLKIWITPSWDSSTVKDKSGVEIIFTTKDTEIILNYFQDTFEFCVIESAINLTSLMPPWQEKLIKKVKNIQKESLCENIKKTLTLIRSKKSQEEINKIIKATTLTCKAFEKTLAKISEGYSEKKLSDVFKGNLIIEGADICFSPIISSGEHTLILHHTPSDKIPKEGDLLLIDVGASYDGYCIDMTRTIPISGKLTPQQDTLYSIVLEALEAAIKSVYPGQDITVPSQVAFKIIQEKLLAYKIIKEPSKIYSILPHAVMHSIGIDVHEWINTKQFEPGQIIAIEPGIYIRPDTEIHPRWWNIGIRLEETVLVTETSAEVITNCIPVSKEKVFDLINKRRNLETIEK